MATVKTGDTVQVHYTGTLADGQVFDTSEAREPLAFKVGDGQLLKRFEEAVVGLEVGGKRRFTVPACEAYGAPQEELVIRVDRAELPPDFVPVIGESLDLAVDEADDAPIPFKVTGVTATEIVLDANHPLAGEDLTFDITLVAIAVR